jgi:hypothetical protein
MRKDFAAQVAFRRHCDAQQTLRHSCNSALVFAPQNAPVAGTLANFAS